MRTIHTLFIYLLGILLLFLASCKKWAEVEPPVTSTNAANVFQSDATAISALTGIYAKLSGASNDFTTLSVYAGLSADELTLWNLGNTQHLEYYRNQLSANSTSIIQYWNIIYPYLYLANSAIDGLTVSETLSPNVKNQLLGEAKFVRAFCLFYLTNLYGEVAIPLTPDYMVNALLPRRPVAEIYKQIITDLKSAKELLNADYRNITLSGTTTERVRPNRFVAQALLARTYLFAAAKDATIYADAEKEASSVIEQKSLYDTVSINQVFLKSSKEAIWQLQPIFNGVNANTADARLFILPSTGPSTTYPVYLSTSLTNKFEANDLRKTNWIGTLNVGTTVYEYAYKYKIGAVSSTTEEYLMVLRLAEQYLIRAEARANIGNTEGALKDLNLIRKRARLLPLTTTDKPSLISAILAERQRELFTEWGHRWLDLKRNAIVEQVMSAETVKKGGLWKSYQALFPIPVLDLQRNINLSQNAGYEK